jgi:hypothetical protein
VIFVQRVILLSTTFLAAMMAACTPQSGPVEPDGGDSAPETMDGSGTIMDQATDTHDSDAAGLPADDFLSSEAIQPYEAGERGQLNMDSLAGALSGETFYVSLDNCPYDDAGWQEGNDPLAGLRCGYNYYSSINADGELAFTGPLEPFGTIFTAPGAISEDGVTVWGITFGVRLDGRIIDGSDNAIGHIALGEAPASE